MLSAVLIACVLSPGFGSIVSLAQASKLDVKLEGFSAGKPLSVALNGGRAGNKTATTTPDASGSAALALEIADMGQAQVRTEVYVYDCRDGSSKVVLVVQGETAPEDQNCNKRVAGFFLLGKDHNITIGHGGTVGTGSLVRNPWVWVGVGGGLAAIIGATAGGDTATSTTPAPATTTTTTGGSVIGLVGNYPMNGTGTGNCPGFSSTSPLVAIIAVANAPANMINFTLTHTSFGFVFPSNNVLVTFNGTTGVFTAPTTATIGGTQYNSATQVQVTGGGQMTLTQTLTPASSPSCSESYSGTGNRQ
jgi:hypothetical protein